MGVTGLWQILKPTGQPVTLESLDGKILAVDISIWLHQISKGYRDRDGNPLPNAHLMGLFSRICKLLYYGIRPVFVFDGGVPALKRDTMLKRRQKTSTAESKSKQQTNALLKNYMKTQAIHHTMAEKGDRPRTQAPIPHLADNKVTWGDMYKLPEIPESDRPTDFIDKSWEERDSNREFIASKYEDLDELDVDSPEFWALPTEIRHEILTEKKELEKHRAQYESHVLPQESGDFSNYQVSKLVKQSTLSNKIVDTQKELNSACTSDFVENLMIVGHRTIQSRRIVSDDTSHVILIKKDRDQETGEVSNKNIEAENLLSYFESDNFKEEHTETDLDDELVSDDVADDNGTILGKKADDKTRRNIVTVAGLQSALKYAMQSIDENIDKKDELIEVEPKLESVDTTLKLENKHLLKGVDKIIISESDDSDFIESTPKRIKLDENLESSKSEKSEKINKAKLDTEVKVANSGMTSSKLVLDLKADSMKTLSVKSLETDIKSDALEKTVKVQDIYYDDVIDLRDESNGKIDEKEVVQVVAEDKQVEVVDDGTIKETSVSSEESDNDDDFIQISDSETPTADKADVVSLYDLSDSAPEDMQENPQLQSDPEEDDGFLEEVKSMTENQLTDYAAELDNQAKVLREERGKQDRLAQTVNDQMSIEAQELLRLFGIPYIVSPMEAEAQCAFLDVNDLVDGIITNDSDVWLFGGRRIYKNMFNQEQLVEKYHHAQIRSQLGLSRDKLINIALLCGSDYATGVAGIGPVTAIEVLAEFKGDGIESLINLKKWWDDFHKLPKSRLTSKIKGKLRHLHFSQGFPNPAVCEAYYNPTVDDSKEPFSWKRPDLGLLRDYTKLKFGWTKTKTDESLLPVLKRLSEKKTQLKIADYFNSASSSSYLSQEPRDVTSQRLKRALQLLGKPEREARKMEPEINYSKTGIGEPESKKGKSSARVKKGKKTQSKGDKTEARKDNGGTKAQEPNGKKDINVPREKMKLITDKSSKNASDDLEWSDFDDDIDLENIINNHVITAKPEASEKSKTDKKSESGSSMYRVAISKTVPLKRKGITSRKSKENPVKTDNSKVHVPVSLDQMKGNRGKKRNQPKRTVQPVVYKDDIGLSESSSDEN